jgi:hypothetical protein
MIKRVIKLDNKLLILAIFLILAMPTFAQVVPVTPTTQQVCDQMVILNRIQQEHQLTRKFLVDTFNQQSATFFSEADKRMAYLENLYEEQMRNAVLSLGFLWLCIALFVQATFGFFQIMWKNRTYRKMKADISQDVLETLKREIKESAKIKGNQRPVAELKNIETKPPINQEQQEKIRMDELMAKLDSMKVA